MTSWRFWDVTTLEVVLSVVIGEIGEFDVARASRDLESSDAAPSHPGYSRVYSLGTQATLGARRVGAAAAMHPVHPSC